MFDENAFGVLVSYYDIENDEYALEPDAFATRWREFRAAWQECLGIWQLGQAVRAVHFGHSLYLEVAEGEQSEDPIVWLKMVRARIAEKGFPTVGVVSFGGRWLEDEAASREEEIGGVHVQTVSLPSEPLRRALAAEAASRFDEEEAPEGWGPGIYADTDAIEALGKKFKNAPTPLVVAGATFYRVAG
jgi:hypothetical protein